MEPTRPGGVIDDLAKQLFGPGDPTVGRRRRRAATVATVRSIAFDVAIIVGLALAALACVPLVIWLWLVVL